MINGSGTSLNARIFINTKKKTQAMDILPQSRETAGKCGRVPCQRPIGQTVGDCPATVDGDIAISKVCKTQVNKGFRIGMDDGFIGRA